MVKTKKTNDVPTFKDKTIIYANNTPYRILSREHVICADGHEDWYIWLIDLSVNYFSILKMLLSELMKSAGAGIITSGRDTEDTVLLFLDKAEDDRSNKLFNNISNYVVSLYPDYTLLQQRGVHKPTLLTLAEDCGVTVKTIRKYVLDYMQSGGSIESVIDKRKLLNNKPVTFTGKVGGVKKDGKDNMVVNDRRLKDIYRETYDRFLEANKAGKRPKTLREAYDMMLISHFSTYDSEKGLELLPEDQRPSYQRFTRWVRVYGKKMLLQEGSL